MTPMSSQAGKPPAALTEVLKALREAELARDRAEGELWTAMATLGVLPAVPAPPSCRDAAGGGFYVIARLKNHDPGSLGPETEPVEHEFSYHSGGFTYVVYNVAAADGVRNLKKAVWDSGLVWRTWDGPGRVHPPHREDD